MKVGIDARKAADFGIGTYIRSISALLAEQNPDWEWVLFHLPGDEDLLPEGSNVTLVVEPAPTYSLRELLSLSRQARRAGLDLYHSPHYTLPYRLPCPAVVTIHDLIHVVFKEYLPHVPARYYARHMIGRAVREAAGIITVSRSSARDIHHHFPGNGKEVSVIANGVDQTFTARPLKVVKEWLSTTLDLKRAYLLFVGNPKRHKNLDLLMRGFARLQTSYTSLDLVVVGGSESHHVELEEKARNLGIERKVRLFGTVDHDTLAFLYSASTAFVFPSLYEGFGLPPLEAMACGAPVVASNSSSIPEVLGPAAAYFSPESIDSLMTALCRVLDSTEYRTRLSRMGLARAKLFTWNEAARRTMDVYRRVLAGER
jgi:alpha-1,3-rhamnosyl/mannosyltransferase